jgi:Tol biopolymer transport system component
VSIVPADFQLSPDGTRIVFAEGISPDIWMFDLERGARTRLTSDPQVDHNPIWSPDGSVIAFDSHRNGSREIYEKRADGAAPERMVLDAGAHDVRVTDWSDDGRFLIFHRDSCIGCDYDIWVLPREEGQEAFAYTNSRFDERFATLSPDGRWMAFMTSESGIYEVIVQSFPDPTRGRWQVSANGGSAPVWARDGKELYYEDVTGSIVRVPIETGSGFEMGRAERLAAAPGAYQWAVTQDGLRLLIADPGATGAQAPARSNTFPIHVILNWTSMLGP